MIDLAEHAALDELPERLDGGRETLVLSDHEQPTAPPGLRHEPGGGPGIGGHGFVEHDMFSGLERGQRDGRMQMVGQCDRDDVMSARPSISR